jgi:signal transduction histidine kinase/integral membrane sensor domain MASE1/ActR/RegA family two-component response regulator
MNSRRIRSFFLVIAVAAVYFGASKLGLSMAFLQANVSPVWPPTGLAIAVVLWLGYRASPGVLLGAFLANRFLTDVSVTTASAIAVGNTLEAICAVYLLRRFVGSRSPFNRAVDVLKFVILAAMLSTAVSATIGNVSLCMSGAAAWKNFGWLWLTWWSGDGVGALVVTPLILTWIEKPYERWSQQRLAEAALLLLSLVVISATIYTGLFLRIGSTRPWGHITIPLLLWAAFRFGPRGVSTAMAVLSAIAIWGTIHGFGGFAVYSPNEALLFSQGYIADLAITTLSLAAIITERRRAERQRTGSLAVTRILAESPAMSDAVPHIIQRICKTFGWEIGAMWGIDPDANVLRCVKVWPSRGAKASKFELVSYELTYPPGAGLPGRVWASLKPAWIPDVTKDGNFPRAPFAAAEGLHAAFAFPILSGDQFLGLMEFFSSQIREPDEDLLATFSGIGSQIGQFVERKRAEEERERFLGRELVARNEAEEANRIKDEFLATLSHELRTPLTAMLGWLAMLRRQRLDDETAAHAIETVERSAKMQAQLVEDLVDVSRIVRGKFSLEVRPIDLYPVIEAAVDIVRPAADAKGIQISVEREPALGAVSGDPARLQQVIWNLLSNAVKFTPRAGRIQVSLRRAESSAEVVVSDTGMGIRPDFLPHAFERFRQAEGSLTRAHRGLGLGLAIVRHLVELHGGTVRADSPGEGQGTTFTIRLPLAVLKPTEEARLSRSYREFKPTTPEALRQALAGLRVLVVEDEHDAREFLLLTLEYSGAKVEAVESVQDALRSMTVFKPDVLLSDIGLPGESGYELIRKIRSLPSAAARIPAIALTAYAADKDRELALSAGYHDHLAKPIEPGYLVEVIGRLVARNPHNL